MLSVVGASSSEASIVRGIESFGEPDDIGLDAVEPHRVGIDQKERSIAELRQRLGDAAAGAEQRPALIGNDDLRPRPRRQMPLHGVGEVMHVDHRALDAGIGKPIERIIDQGFAADRDQGLRDVAVMRPHPRAETGRQHYRAVRHHRIARPSTAVTRIRNIIAHPDPHICGVPGLQRRQRRVRQRALQIGP